MFFPRRIALVLGAAVTLAAPGGAVEPGLASRGLRKSPEVSFDSDPNLVGDFLNDFLEGVITVALDECVGAYNGEDPVECDVYFNPHTDFSFRRNPSAVGVLRGPLYYDGEEAEGVYFFDVPEATSEIMDDLMSETGLQSTGGASGDCDGALYRQLGPGIARAENVRVSWDKTGNNAVTLLSSTIILKDVKTQDFRCKFCTNVPGCPSVFDDEPGPGRATPGKGSFYSNLNIIGSHLHTGNSTIDGPPPVFFCKNAPGGVLSPGAPGVAGTPICSGDTGVYTKDR